MHEQNVMLQGCRVLVVEDMMLLADEIGEVLQCAGAQVVGPVGRLEQALSLAGVERLEGAFLDVNLAGMFSYPIADILLSRGVPFAFLTGYDEGTIPPRYGSIPRLSKPVTTAAIHTMLANFCAAAEGSKEVLLS